MRNRVYALLIFVPAILGAQDKSDVREILNRLARLEEQNRTLMEEIRSLRREVAEKTATVDRNGSETPPIEERVAVEERRVDEQAQAKVEADHRFPIQLTGMLLFNAYRNGYFNNDGIYPLTAGPSTGQSLGGGTLRQTVIGLKVQGPEIFAGGKVSGSLYMDLFGGPGVPLNQFLRLRTATVDLAWRNTTVSVGQDKPIFAPREPDSLAQVAASPLSNAGNLWLWQPQARVEQRFHFGDRTTLRAQVGVYQTAESYPGLLPAYQTNLSSARPAAQGRFEVSHQFTGSVYFELASGFHASQTHILGQTLPSRVWSVDGLFRPFPRFDVTGTYFRGENVGILGALRQGVAVEDGLARSVSSQGGWVQFALRPTNRLSFHVYGGEQADRAADLLNGGITRNLVYAANTMYRLGPNVLASFEASQTRTTYLGSGTRLNPHYDLALGYLF